jgi:hypothetical protein
MLSTIFNRPAHETIRIHPGPRALRVRRQRPESKDISQAGIQTAFRILQKEYIRSGDLTFDELNRAALAGLLERLDFGAELIPRKLESVPEAQQGVRSELITPQIAYLRPLAFTERETKEVEQLLAQVHRRQGRASHPRPAHPGPAR